MSLGPKPSKRKGLTLLEVVIAGSMLAVVMTSLSLVLRTARTSWEANDNDYGSVHYAHTVALHFVREAREARSIVHFSSDDVAFELRDGSQMGWRFESDGKEGIVYVRSSRLGEESPLAFGIRNLSFSGFLPDGVTPATTLEDIALIEVQVAVEMGRKANSLQTVTSRVWIRSW